MVRAELPHFLRWLIDWAPPAYVIDKDPRFGVVPFHHESMLRDANENSGAARLKEMIEDALTNGAINPDSRCWKTVTQLRKTLMIEKSFQGVLERELGRERMAQALQELGCETRIRPNRTVEYLVHDPKHV